MYGGTSLLVENVIGVVVAAAYAGGVSLVLLKLLDRVMGLRPDKDTEREGLDVTLHGEEAYSAMEGSMIRERAFAEAEERELELTEA